jgi:hypothetical protein
MCNTLISRIKVPIPSLMLLGSLAFIVSPLGPDKLLPENDAE